MFNRTAVLFLLATTIALALRLASVARTVRTLAAIR